MHEMALCTEVVSTVLDTASQADAVSVDRVDMVIGEMRDIITDMFDSFFHYLAKGTIAENAIVSYTSVPLVVRCHACKKAFRLDITQRGETNCPQCNAHDYTMISGMEFLIESIDVTTRAESEDAEAAA